jgi:hypothetical protein
MARFFGARPTGADSAVTKSTALGAGIVGCHGLVVLLQAAFQQQLLGANVRRGGRALGRKDHLLYRCVSRNACDRHCRLLRVPMGSGDLGLHPMGDGRDSAINDALLNLKNFVPTRDTIVSQSTNLCREKRNADFRL